MPKSLRLAGLLAILFATPALAQEEAEGGLLSIDTGLMVWTVVIFLIVLFVLYRAAFPKILGAVEAREKHISDLLASAAKDRAEAQALLEAQRKERDATRAQVQEQMAEGRTAGEKLREEILAEARREQQELLQRTRRDIRQEMDRSLAELRVQAVDLAIAAASRLVERNLDDEDNRTLVREYLERVEIAEPTTAGA